MITRCITRSVCLWNIHYDDGSLSLCGRLFRNANEHARQFISMCWLNARYSHVRSTSRCFEGDLDAPDRPVRRSSGDHQQGPADRASQAVTYARASRCSSQKAAISGPRSPGAGHLERAPLPLAAMTAVSGARADPPAAAARAMRWLRGAAAVSAPGRASSDRPSMSARRPVNNGGSSGYRPDSKGCSPAVPRHRYRNDPSSCRA
jgi:hypothetical protein